MRGLIQIWWLLVSFMYERKVDSFSFSTTLAHQRRACERSFLRNRGEQQWCLLRPGNSVRLPNYELPSSQETKLFSRMDIDMDSSYETISTPEAKEKIHENELVKQVIPSNILGPPEPLKSLQIGQTLDAFRRGGGMDKEPSQASNYTIERIGYTPDAFVLRNFLSPEECNEIKSMANQYNMTQAETITKNDTSSRKNCQVAWIPSSAGGSGSESKSNLVANLVSATANLLLSKSVLGHPSAGVEDLQVLKYGVGGEFVLHHDGEPRVLTVIYYCKFTSCREAHNHGNRAWCCAWKRKNSLLTCTYFPTVLPTYQLTNFLYQFI